MEFTHRPYIPGETITAISTAPGEGAISIVRISGSTALNVAAKIFSGPVHTYLTHTAHYGFVLTPKGEKIDEALLLIMKGHRSFTGEDTIELQCHGGMVASKKILEAAIQAGARLASPGEFSLKAFMNGKIDLAQAEAVQQLIGAKNNQAFDSASHHLQGHLSEKIHGFQQDLTQIAAILEAWVDFPEEGLEFASFESICERLERLISQMDTLINSYSDGKKIREGISLCIVGAPNVGKSSLMNALLRKERAIVTPIAGTTRDILEEDVLFNGLHFHLIDTAGIRETTEIIEQEGIRRTFTAMQGADVILFVLDIKQGLRAEEKTLLEGCAKEKTLLIWNKIDLDHLPPPSLGFPYSVAISAKEKIGLNALQQTLEKMIWTKGVPSKDELFLTSYRHKEALQKARDNCNATLEGLREQLSPEFLSFDLRQSLCELGYILGTNITEDILSSIFSQFCIGK